MRRFIRGRSAPWRVGLALACVFALTSPLVSAPQANAALPGALPTHFAFGVSAGQGDTWMPQTGIAWDYRMQYLAGGVNTGGGWETWNGNGTFPLNYATESSQHGYISVFPYYELLQSNGSCGGCNENQKDITNLNTPSLMSAYFANFAMLMKRLGPGTYDTVHGFGGPVLVNIEPDFTGGYAVQAANNNSVCFGFCTAQGNDPTFLKASVSNSGFADVAGYPNTYAGYVQALAHLRDLYAPNVVLGLDVSPWGTGDDIGLDSNPGTNVAALGQQVGSFLNRAGPHDVLFNNPLDRDAGQYKALFGQNRWWDRLNVALPNFHRWEQYLQGASTADGGKSMLLWQVPIGNQYFDTENNTNGHFQDNRPEYIFGHVSELIQYGIVGAIFAAGNGGSTTQTDSMKDGVTNPASFCTTDGISSGQVCNTHTSSVADDDGGFIRMSAQSYYQHPVALSGGGTSSTATPTPTAVASSTATATPTATGVAATYMSGATVSPSSVAPGQSVSLAASVTSSAASTVLVDLEVYDAAGNKQFQQFWDNQSFAASQTRTFTATWQVPSTAATGAYSVDVGVFTPGWGTLLNWNGSAGGITVAAAAPTSTPTSAPTNTPTSTPTRAPTNTPTSTPTRTPTPRATSTPVATATPGTPSFTTSGSVSPSSVARGGTASITVSARSATAMSALVDVEIWSASGTKVFQQFWDNQAFTAGQTRTYTAAWNIPTTLAPGTYTITVGVFSTGWGTLYNWNGNAATLTIT